MEVTDCEPYVLVFAKCDGNWSYFFDMMLSGKKIESVCEAKGGNFLHLFFQSWNIWQLLVLLYLFGQLCS